jgi:hypothetical protein
MLGMVLLKLVKLSSIRHRYIRHIYSLRTSSRMLRHLQPRSRVRQALRQRRARTRLIVAMDPAQTYRSLSMTMETLRCPRKKRREVPSGLGKMTKKKNPERRRRLALKTSGSRVNEKRLRNGARSIRRRVCLPGRRFTSGRWPPSESRSQSSRQLHPYSLLLTQLRAWSVLQRSSRSDDGGAT